jgi:putative transcription antitermination factor YqgF
MMFDYIALDWGEKFIGMAFGSSFTGLIIPYQGLILYPDFKDIFKTEIQNRNPKVAVVGLPLNFKLQKTDKTLLVEKFILELKQEFANLEFKTINERGSSKINESTLFKKNQQNIHNLSASTILKSYFDLLITNF